MFITAIIIKNNKNKNKTILSESPLRAKKIKLLQQILTMFPNKTIANMKVKKHGKTTKEILEIQQESISHIRSISEDLLSLMDELSNIEPSMFSPTASPIKKVHKKGIHHLNQSRQEDLKAFSFLKNQTISIQSNQVTPKRIKKPSGPAIHYASYMKPTHHVKEKIRDILIEERDRKDEYEERERKRVQELKRSTNRNYIMVESRYQKYNEQMGGKAEAIADRQIQKQFSEMSGVTFQPQINSNLKISDSFEQRLQTNKHKKSMKQGQIIKDMIKGQTYKPKINSHKISQSKIKKIWSPNGSDEKSRLSKTQQLTLFPNSFNSSPTEQRDCLRAEVRDVEFVIDERLFK